MSDYGVSGVRTKERKGKCSRTVIRKTVIIDLEPKVGDLLGLVVTCYVFRATSTGTYFSFIFAPWSVLNIVIPKDSVGRSFCKRAGNGNGRREIVFCFFVPVSLERVTFSVMTAPNSFPVT